ncbi:hypothetical protein SAMN05518856_110246 [Paenibacillus sp. OK003]|nr:hypothetical protein SAMN05518856_110246 [Paenibacillus sp. OK003]
MTREVRTVVFDTDLQLGAYQFEGIRFHTGGDSIFPICDWLCGAIPDLSEVDANYLTSRRNALYRCWIMRGYVIFSH